MESDYYLHNFHVKAGRGTSYSMKTYERAFGIEWSKDEDGDSVVSGQRHTRPSTLKRGTSRDSAASATNTVLQVESPRVSLVRSRCKTQSDVLSSWWKVALQSYVQQRMWMKLGRPDSESILPPRYDRLYQPEKIAQFDRFFARGWAAPVRRSHTAQHSEGSERDAEAMELRRVISGKRPESSSSAKDDGPKGLTLGDVVGGKDGYDPRFETSLQMFVSEHDISSMPSLQNVDYVGRLDIAETKEPEEYARYVSASSSVYSAPHSYQRDKIAEFKACLHDCSLQADNVAGIREVRSVCFSIVVL